MNNGSTRFIIFLALVVGLLTFLFFPWSGLMGKNNQNEIVIYAWIVTAIAIIASYFISRAWDQKECSDETTNHPDNPRKAPRIFSPKTTRKSVLVLDFFIFLSPFLAGLPLLGVILLNDIVGENYHTELVICAAVLTLILVIASHFVSRAWNKKKKCSGETTTKPKN